MNLNKHQEFFNPVEKINKEIHIIGCGAIGSYVALQLAKLGCTDLNLWDFDTVEPHNITNQVYTKEDVAKTKLQALNQHLKNNNPDITIKLRGMYTCTVPLRGYVFCCVDNIETRKNIYMFNEYNPMIELLIDGRIGLEQGQVYTTKWQDHEQVENLIQLSDFKHDEVKNKTSACGTTLSVSPTVLITVSNMISCFINYVNKKQIPKIIYIDAFAYKTKPVF